MIMYVVITIKTEIRKNLKSQVVKRNDLWWCITQQLLDEHHIAIKIYVNHLS